MRRSLGIYIAVVSPAVRPSLRCPLTPKLYLFT